MGYEAARAIWNGMITKRPALVVFPAGVADVQRAITFAGSTTCRFRLREVGTTSLGTLSPTVA